ncbi:MAG: hypothetical protein Q8865_10500 [Bacillota bacterium]|nr:hypothetical protein [Bacillota bacterium]
MVTVKRKDFEKIDDASLIWMCIEPTIKEIRGKNLAVKQEVYASLNTGLQALLMFQVLYGHTFNGVEEFYTHLSYLLSNDGVWSQLERGMQYFGDMAMVEILQKMHVLFLSINTEKSNNAPGQYAELSKKMMLINESLSKTMPLTIKLVAAYIRNNKDEYMQVAD